MASQRHRYSLDQGPHGQDASPGCEDWPYLDQDVLGMTRSRKVCMTCYWLRHHPGVNCIPLLTCQLHQGLLAHGEHLTRSCHGWTKKMAPMRP